MKEFSWRKMIPLSCKDARKALEKGLEVYALRPSGKSVRMRCPLAIKIHAKAGGCFGVEKKAFADAFSEYDTTYRIIKEDYDPVDYNPEDFKATVHFRSSVYFEAFARCYEILENAVKENGIEDGNYWVTISMKTMCLEDTIHLETREGVVVIKDGAIVDAPFEFTAPF